MNSKDTLSFAVRDLIDDKEVTPSRISLALLGEFQTDVSDFLRGANRDVRPSDVMVSIEPGSFQMVASGLLAVASLWSDIAHLKDSQALAAIDDRRAKVIERWQQRAIEHPNRAYFLSNKEARISISVNSSSSFHLEKNTWACVEKYLLGTITDMGGATRPNVHLLMESGATVMVSSSKNQLAQDEKNRLYKQALLRVSAEENLISGQLRNITLISFEKYNPLFDEAEFQKMTEQGSQAWKDIDDPASWIDELRGNN